MQKTGRRGRSFGLNAATVVAACIAALMMLSAGQAADPQPGLIGQWPLAENAQDTSGNGHNGVLKGGAAFSTEDKALVLDGVDSYVNLGDVPIAASFTIGLWICPDWPDKDKTVMRLMGKFRLADLKVLALFSDEKGRLWVYISEDGAEDGKRSIVKATAEPVVAESGEWRFVVVRWDSTKAANGLGVLVDGSPVPVVAASEANITRLSTKKVDLTLGAYDIQTVTENGVTREIVKNPFRGMMSGLVIWDNALSDEAVAAAFSAGRIAEPPEAAKPPEAAAINRPGQATQEGQATQSVSAVKALADNAQAADAEADYNTLFARKQQILSSLNAGTLADTDIAEAARLAKVLAEDLYSEQRLALAQKLRLRWLTDKSAMARRTEAEITTLLDAIWFACPEQAREILAAWFSDDALWNAVSGKTLAFAAMLAGKPWSTIEMPGSVIDPSILPAIEARLLTQEPGLDREALGNCALAFGYAGHLQYSRNWAMKMYAKVLADPAARKTLGVTDLKFIASVFSQEWLKGTQEEYPEFLEVLIRLAGAGKLPYDKATLDSLARLCSGPNARQAITSEVEAHPDANRLPLARILTAAITRGQDLDAWCKRVDSHISSSQADALAFWNMVRGDAETIRIYPAVPGRRLPWIRKAEASVTTDGMRLASASELADYFSGCSLPGKVADELAGKVELFAGDKANDAVALIQALDTSRTDVARKQARFRRLIQHERLKRQLDYLERTREQAAKRGDTARVQALDAQLVAVRKEVSR